MFKKSLLALALTGVASTASAVEMPFTTQTLSVEGITAGLHANTTASLDKEFSATSVKVKLGAEYSTGDTITFTISGGSFSDAGYTLTKTANTPAATGKAPGSVSFGFLSATDTTVSFRVTSVTKDTATDTNPVTTIGGEYTLTGTDSATTNTVNLKVTSIAKDGTVSIKADAKTSTGLTIDVADKSSTTANEDTAVVFKGIQQYAFAATAKDATVDVAVLRKGFDGTAPAPSYLVDETAADVTATNVTETKSTITVKGDFTGIKSFTVTPTTTPASAATALKIADDKQSASVTLSAALVDNAAYTFAYNLETDEAKKVALTAPNTFTMTLDVVYGSDKVLNIAKDQKISTWKLNGDVANIDFLPFQTAYARAVTVTNNGTVEGDIHAEIFSAGKMVASAKVGTAAKYTVTDISAAVDKLAADNGVTGYAGVRVTTNAPDANIQVNAIYYSKDDKDRVKTN